MKNDLPKIQLEAVRPCFVDGDKARKSEEDVCRW